MTYLEDASENPYLHSLVSCESDFDAGANQRWFLERVRKFIQGADPSCTLVIDQDPDAIVNVYGKMFHDESRLPPAEYAELLDGLAAIEKILAAWREPRLRIFLDASPELLRERIVRSRGDRQAPSVAWLTRLTGYFKEWGSGVAGFTSIATDRCSVGQVIELVSQRINQA